VVFFCSSHSDDQAMSSPNMFLKYGDELLETENTKEKGPEWKKKIKMVRLYLKEEKELVPFLDSK